MKRMAGTTRLELATSAVTGRCPQVLSTTYKAVGDCQVLDSTQKSDKSRVGLRVEKCAVVVRLDLISVLSPTTDTPSLAGVSRQKPTCVFILRLGSHKVIQGGRIDE